MHVVLFCKSTKEMLLAGDELAQVVSCPWIMRDSGGSLAQNHWQGDLGLPAGRQDNAGGGNDVDADCHAKILLTTKGPQFMRNNGLQEMPSDELKQRALSGLPMWLQNMLMVSVSEGFLNF